MIPEVVDRPADPEAPLGISYDGLIPVMIKAIQEQQVTINALTQETAPLKARLAAIETALDLKQMSALTRSK